MEWEGERMGRGGRRREREGGERKVGVKGPLLWILDTPLYTYTVSFSGCYCEEGHSLYMEFEHFGITDFSVMRRTNRRLPTPTDRANSDWLEKLVSKMTYTECRALYFFLSYFCIRPITVSNLHEDACIMLIVIAAPHLQ